MLQLKAFSEISGVNAELHTTTTVGQLTRSQEGLRNKVEFRLLKIQSFPDCQIIGIDASELQGGMPHAQPDILNLAACWNHLGSLNHPWCPGPALEDCGVGSSFGIRFSKAPECSVSIQS